MNYAAVVTFVETKLIPAGTAIFAQVPALLSADEARVTTAINAIVAVVAGLQSDLQTLATAVKSAT
jgi:hypothetical protein